ncbi:hypothetical protein [Sphingomonas sp.]|jgi:hypothetical protein|uniref:hypothetical protein n=1 Tax=Sphingomonas sp. TaxID=28214 RepID=UPI002D7FA2B7|nr:hypothetical protein [Sphingomonas sp.]HEU0043331.1 hypothetical protein [Sphingomonas sp.]
MSDSPFTPVPVRARRDGWTPQRQRDFIAALADVRCVVVAARLVGRSFQTAYRLRARADAVSFAAAWDPHSPDPSRRRRLPGARSGASPARSCTVAVRSASAAAMTTGSRNTSSRCAARAGPASGAIALRT